VRMMARARTIIATGRIRLILVAALLASPALAAADDSSRVAAANTTGSDASASLASLAPLPPAAPSKSADFRGEPASNDAMRVADWVVTSGDNNGQPFAIIDKVQAKVFVFEKGGRLRGATFALLGKARGDDTVAGIGSRKLSTIRPEERTTPAGRFVADLGHDFKQDILWIDYSAAISLHRVITGSPSDHRRQRLATTSTLDKRISYGCINVPAKFYDEVVRETFTGTSGIVYILPEIKQVQDVFSLAKQSEVSAGNGVSPNHQ